MNAVKFILALSLLSVAGPTATEAGFFKDKVLPRANPGSAKIDCNRIYASGAEARALLQERGYALVEADEDASLFDYRLDGRVSYSAECELAPKYNNRRPDPMDMDRAGICQYRLVLSIGIADEVQKRPEAPALRYIITQTGDQIHAQSPGGVLSREEVIAYQQETVAMERAMSEQIFDKVCKATPLPIEKTQTVLEPQ